MYGCNGGGGRAEASRLCSFDRLSSARISSKFIGADLGIGGSWYGRAGDSSRISPGCPTVSHCADVVASSSCSFGSGDSPTVLQADRPPNSSLTALMTSPTRLCTTPLSQNPPQRLAGMGGGFRLMLSGRLRMAEYRLPSSALRHDAAAASLSAIEV